MIKKATNSDFDLAGEALCEALSSTFNVARPDQSGLHGVDPGRSSAVSIGMEIEVPWSSYFPDLWSKYGLAGRRISALDPQDLKSLTDECSVIEESLLPKLRQTIACGIPRGNDRYWEYAFRPVHDTALLVEQVQLLTAAGLLPRDKKHALHITVGGIPRCTSLYYLSMLLELEFVDPKRIQHGVELTKNTIYTGWARKGLAGILQKQAHELEGGCLVASEIRMLQLPCTDLEFSRLMDTFQWGANAIYDIRQGEDTEAADQWRSFEASAVSILKKHGLPNSNWMKEGVQYEIWDRFCAAMPAMRDELRSCKDAFQERA